MNLKTEHRFLPADEIEARLATGALESTVFAMGCFWGPDSQFGSLEGVIQTRVGYAGATPERPTYRNIKGHAEAIRVIFDPAVVTFDELLAAYQKWHVPYRSTGQYRSMLFPQSPAQASAAERYVEGLGPNPPIEVVSRGVAESRFWDAEDYHQKYRLRQNSALVANLEEVLGARWDEHVIATKLNGAAQRGQDASAWLSVLPPATQKLFKRG